MLLSLVSANAEQTLTLNSAAVDQAITRALGWIERNPATLRDGGLVDMIDEGVLFLVLQGLTENPQQHRQFTEALQQRVPALDQLPAFAEWVQEPNKKLIEHYHLILAAHLMRSAGQPSRSETVIVEEAQQALMTAPYGNPTVRLTMAAFLSHLGGAPPSVDIESLLAYSLIEQIANRRLPPLPPEPLNEYERRGVSVLLYAVVHEVLALTDFGRRCPSPWLKQRRAGLAGFILEAIEWARLQDNPDLLSELVMTVHFLREPLRGQLNTAIAMLVNTQQANGSWGTYPTPRKNKKRHAVQTALAALWAYRDQQEIPGSTRAQKCG